MVVHALFVDGSIFSVKSKSIQDAVSSLYEYSDSDDFESFIKDLNILEWIERGHRFVKNMSSGVVVEFGDLKCQLPRYKVEKTEQPINELAEEWEIIL